MVKEPETLPSLWDKSKVGEMSEVDQLVYASNLLGSDPRITNFGGGNTSVKLMDLDPLTGESVEVLWVKGSGGDLGTAKKSGFASLYLDKVLGLENGYEMRRAVSGTRPGRPSYVEGRRHRCPVPAVHL
jgi:rhamnose utilization protein RhaD (predicted bifunctional aldolase and dehydrogenase)